jgi:hypothetical protein
MLKTLLDLRARIDRLTKLIEENKERSRSIAITIEDMQDSGPHGRSVGKILRLGLREANSK